MEDATLFNIGLLVGILFGAVSSMLMIKTTAIHAIGYGLDCANKVLNNPEVYIDTTYTICQQDTTVTYHFVKDR